MSRAQGIRGFFASQTCTSRIQIVCDLNHRNLTGKMLPCLGTRGLRAKQVRRYGKPPGIASSVIGHPP